MQQDQELQQQQMMMSMRPEPGDNKVKLEEDLHHHHHHQQQQQQMILQRQQHQQHQQQLMAPDEIHHQQQQQQMMMQRQDLAKQQQLQAHLNLLNQQRLLKQQQQQQQQLLHAMPPNLQRHQQLQSLQQQQQVHQLQQQQQQHQAHHQLHNHHHHHHHQQQQTLLNPATSHHLLALPPKQQTYEPGSCSRRVMQFIYHQRHRPPDNSISFWRRFIAEYFAPRAKKRWCVSLYGNGNNGRQPTGVFPQDVWQCEICGTKPGRGFETTVEVLPRLCKIKYDSGIVEELLFVDLPHENRLQSGLVVLEYGKAIQESIFEQLRVVRDGQLRIIFSPDLKILSWEFCARSHEELLPRRMIVPQVSQLASVAQKYQQTVSQTGTTGLSTQELQTNCNMFVSSSRNLARNLEVPTVNDLGYTKRYVRCLQISEVVNSMKDLIDFSHENGMGPKASLINFPRRMSGLQQLQAASLQTLQHQQQKPQEQQQQLSSSASMIQEPEHMSLLASSSRQQQHQQHQQHPQQQQQQQIGSSLQGLLNTFPSFVQQQNSNNLPSSTIPPPPPPPPPSSMNSCGIPSLKQMPNGGTSNLSNGFQAGQMIGNSGSLQSPTSSNSNTNLLGSAQQDTQSVVHHLLQEMMNSSSNNNNSSSSSLNHLHQQQQQHQHHHQLRTGHHQKLAGLYSQDGVQELAENGILSNGFGSLPFEWKSP